MPRKYTKVEQIAEAVFARKAAGETNREIAESYGLTLEQVKNLVTRQNQKSGKSNKDMYLDLRDALERQLKATKTSVPMR